MVESTAVHVEALDAHRHVPRLAVAVVRTLRVHHPVVTWGGHLDGASRWNEVGGEVCREDTLGVFWVHQADAEILVVKVIAWIDGDFLREHIHLARHGIDRRCEYDARACASQRCTVHANLGSLRIAARRQEVGEHQCRAFRIIGLVGKVQDITCRLVKWHVALYGLFNPDAWLVRWDGRYIKHCSGLEPLRHTLTLVWLASDTANGAEDEAGVNLSAPVGITQRIRCQASATHFVEHIQRVVVEDVDSRVECLLRLGAVDFHRQP